MHRQPGLHGLYYLILHFTEYYWGVTTQSAGINIIRSVPYWLQAFRCSINNINLNLDMNRYCSRQIKDLLHIEVRSNANSTIWTLISVVSHVPVTAPLHLEKTFNPGLALRLLRLIKSTEHPR